MSVQKYDFDVCDPDYGYDDVFYLQNIMAHLIPAAMPEKLSSRFPTMSNTNRLIQRQKKARILKFWT